MNYIFKQSKIEVSAEDLATYKVKREKLAASMKQRGVNAALVEKLEKTIADLQQYEETGEETALVRKAALNILKMQDRAPLGLILAEKLKEV